VLQQPPPGRNANFFELGGDSLTSTRVMTRLRQQLLLELPTTFLFDYPTISSLAEQLDKLLDQALAAPEDVTS
jgi:acyl carrier protein